MTFEEAMRAAFATDVYREGWAFRICHSGQCTMVVDRTTPVVKYVRRYVPTPEDMEATDWKRVTTAPKAGDRT